MHSIAREASVPSVDAVPTEAQAATIDRLLRERRIDPDQTGYAVECLAEGDSFLFEDLANPSVVWRITPDGHQEQHERPPQTHATAYFPDDLE